MNGSKATQCLLKPVAFSQLGRAIKAFVMWTVHADVLSMAKSERE